MVSSCDCSRCRAIRAGIGTDRAADNQRTSRPVDSGNGRGTNGNTGILARPVPLAYRVHARAISLALAGGGFLAAVIEIAVRH